ncbi:hypothetical protein RR11_2239 [Ruegeria sp. R11]|nr:hypothetical protein RR11_2239 [Ruegeria sp. R11]
MGRSIAAANRKKHGLGLPLCRGKAIIGYDKTASQYGPFPAYRPAARA